MFESVFDTVRKIKNREISSVEVCMYFLEKTRNVEGTINSFLYLNEENVYEEAKKVDSLISKGEKTGLLAGIPVAIKDNILTKGLKTTAGSKILEDFIAPYDATVVSKIKENHGIIFGKTNLDEFAMGSSTENSAFKITKNPWDTSRVPGGSSGGSGACVAARQAPLSLGSDTGGSIRLPASFNGVYGLKPTYGRVSRYGLIAFASSLDQIGPFALNVKDLALLFEVIAGHDKNDSTSAPVEVEHFPDLLEPESRDFTLGIIEEIEGIDIHPEVRRVYNETVRFFEKSGFKIKRISTPNLKYSISAYYIISNAEASSNLARYDGIRYGLRIDDRGLSLKELYKKTRNKGFGIEVKRRILHGNFVLSSGYYDAYYLKAQKLRTLIKNDFEHALSLCNAIILPVCPVPPFKIGEKIKNPLEMYKSDMLTLFVNLSGLPGLSFPAGFTADNLPVGMQLIGRRFDEKTLFQIANIFEKEHEFHKRTPTI